MKSEFSGMFDLLDSILVSGQSEVYLYGGGENAPYILTNIDVASQTKMCVIFVGYEAI